MIIVAGLSVRNLEPRVWDSASAAFLPKLRAVMVSYADFHRMPSQRRAAMSRGLRSWLGVSDEVRIYLDNGAFYFLRRSGARPLKQYEEFVATAKPDWWAIPQDYIPTPRMRRSLQIQCYERTMRVNRMYQHDGFVPVVHVGQMLARYTSSILRNKRLCAKKNIALGGIVPNLLRAPKAMPYNSLLKSITHLRAAFIDKEVHIFGIGGTATVHLARLLGVNSVDSAGWRNRAARGLIQLPGCGDRVVAHLGNWRGREPDRREWQALKSCECPACIRHGIAGLKAKGLAGFSCRAVHNLWVLLEEADWVESRIADGTYYESYKTRLDNSVYLPLIESLIPPD